VYKQALPSFKAMPPTRSAWNFLEVLALCPRGPRGEAGARPVEEFGGGDDVEGAGGEGGLS